MERRQVPIELGRKLIAASQATEKARTERDALIVEALRKGASSREIGQLVGLTHSSVQKIGSKAGWPDAKELRRRERETEERRRWEAEIVRLQRGE